MDTVANIMTKDVQTSSENETIMNIARMMYSRKIGSVVIVRYIKPIGIITERDMTYKVVANNIQSKIATAKDIMTSPIISINPNDNVYYAFKVMNEKGIKKLPVVNENEGLVGILTQTDILRYFNQQRKEFVINALRGAHKGVYSVEG
ncbi:CBS domain-containing protein [Candidatus Woesearchaeota archaeon]|nr:CBS domain-containing protein [Candidatus Woesearchaeota archaeon]